ncbi:deoxycytidylate deaminase [Parvularcula flava]|nr:deoxycytidylate deaminase [Aquisalinus luteolus]
MSVLAISAIRSLRQEIHKTASVNVSPEINLAETPVQRQAYIIRQLKRPEEVNLLRSVYGRQFILISAYAPPKSRLRNIESKQRESLGGLTPEQEVHSEAYSIIQKDEREIESAHGQNVNDAFPLGDVFIDATTKSTCQKTLNRFISVFFGNNQISPTRDEYGMYTAKSASLRSSDLSRQVGAAIFSEYTEVQTLGCNEVPKAGGGTYWEEYKPDARDFTFGQDPNDRIKKEIIVDIIDRLRVNGDLSDALLKEKASTDILQKLLENETLTGISESKVMDLIEFGRIIHAEMCAITDAARKGISLRGSKMYVTTFPCHLCAKHIVGAGIKEVVFIEPYPKSYAKELHSDSIDLDEEDPTNKVKFRPFTGISPYRYRDLFEKGKRKKSGKAQEWHMGDKRPMIRVYFPAYFEAEVLLVSALSQKLKQHSSADVTDKK